MLKYTKKGRKSSQEREWLREIIKKSKKIDDKDFIESQINGKEVTTKSELKSVFDAVMEKLSPSPPEKPKEQPVKEVTATEPKPTKEETMSEQTAEAVEEAKETKAETQKSTPSESSGIPEMFNPLSTDIKQRSYNEVPTSEMHFDIPEPDLSKKPLTEEDFKTEEPVAETESEESKEKPEVNPELNDLDPKDKKVACENLVDAVLDGYEMLHEMAKKLMHYDDIKIQEFLDETEVDPEMQIPTPQGDISLMDFITSYNEGVHEIFDYDPDFNESVRPIMIRVFVKHGWGLTDEQMLIYKFGKDAGMKVMMGIGLSKSLKGTMNSIKDLSKQLKRQSEQAVSERVEPDSITKPTKKESKKSEPKDDVVENVETELDE